MATVQTGFTVIYVHIVDTSHYTDEFCWFPCVCILPLI